MTNRNEELIAFGRQLLAQVREQREIVFVHVLGHSNDCGNDQADTLVQCRKTNRPYSVPVQEEWTTRRRWSVGASARPDAACDTAVRGRCYLVLVWVKTFNNARRTRPT